MVNLPNTIADGDAASGDAIQANFSALASALSAITNSEISDTAAISSSKLAERNGVWQEVIEIIPFSDGADYSAPSNTGPFPLSMTTIKQWRKYTPSGKKVALVAVEFHCIAASGSPTPSIQLQIDGTTIGQATDLVTSQYNTIINSTDFAAPLQEIPNQAVFTVQMMQSAAGSGTARGVTMTLTFKGEIVS